MYQELTKSDDDEDRDGGGFLRSPTMMMMMSDNHSVTLSDDDDDNDDDVGNSFTTPVSVQDGFHSWRVQSSAASHNLKYCHIQIICEVLKKLFT